LLAELKKRLFFWKKSRLENLPAQQLHYIIPVLILIAVVKHSAVAQVAPSETRLGLISDTTVCELRSSPVAFDQRQIRVNAYFHFGFEEAGMYDPSCTENSSANEPASQYDQFGFWVEFADRAQHEEVKGYLPLIEDEELHQFYDLEKQRADGMLHATLIGTFYAAKPNEVKPGQFLSLPRGYGHMGCCHLFVVSQVERVETYYSPDLDYSPSWQTPDPHYCYSHETFDTPTDADIRSWQQAANNGSASRRLDSMNVAEEQLEAMRFGRFKDTGWLSSEREIPDDPHQARYFLAPPDDRRTETLLEAKSQPNRKTYEYIASDRKSRMIIVVARPYWLEELAGSADRVIWVPVAAARVACFAPGEKPKPRPE
jgi:hypothetical protein